MTIKWSVVSTVDAPSWLISMHCAFLRDLGCHRILYFIDKPGNFVSSAFASTHDDVSFLICDDRYWSMLGGRPGTVPKRQIANLSFAKTMLEGDYIFHIDIDEFPMVNGSISEILGQVPGNPTSVRMQNVERVFLRGASRWTEGVLRTPSVDGLLIRRTYGARSAFLGNGLSSYIHGKSFTRNHKDVMASVHGEYIDGRETSKASISLNQAMLIHFDCISPIHWKAKIALRTQEVKTDRKLFAHERRLLDYVARSRNRDMTLSKLVNLMHCATPEEAAHWKSAGLALDMPAWFLARLEKAAAAPEMLDADFADRSMAAFYHV